MGDLIFRRRTALVTGGARGIGRAICLRLASEGAKVAVNYQRNEAAAQETLQAIRNLGGDGALVPADVSKPDEVERITAQSRRQLGPIDFLVNNAGIVENVLHDQLTFEKWKRVFEVNVDGPFLATWAVKDEMIARRFGRIVNISSLAGVVKKKDLIHYATAK